MGSLYKRGNTYWLQYYHHGKQIRESSKTSKKMIAKKLLEKREGRIAEGRLPGIYFEKVTFQELADDLINDYIINGKKTTRWVKRKIKIHLDPYFGRMKAVQITTAQVKEYISMRLDEGASNATINRELASLKRMFNLGAKQTPPKIDRVPYIPMLKEDNVRKGFFTNDEFLALREHLPEYLQGFVTFAYRTGWRLSEITNLTWNQVDRNDWTVRLEVGETKNREGRLIFLDVELRAVINHQHSIRYLGCPNVFHRLGCELRDIRAPWKSTCKAIKLQGRIFHDLRRTAIRNMVRAGIAERVAMQISGHKTRSVFDRYNIVSTIVDPEYGTVC